MFVLDRYFFGPFVFITKDIKKVEVTVCGDTQQLVEKWMYLGSVTPIIRLIKSTFARGMAQ